MKLYIIGNGFDISHGLPCRYSDFRIYLEEYKPDVIELMSKYYNIDKDSELWSDFEQSLEADIDYDALTTIIIENIPNIGSAKFRDTDWYDAQLNIERASNELLDTIRSGFEEWIASLQTSEIGKKFNLDRYSYYLTFNYTEILEETYRIPLANIQHIHNKVGEELIFGHGKDLADFDVKVALYGSKDAFLTFDDDGNIESNEVGHERHGEDAVEVFHSNMMKDTYDIIKDKSDYFLRLCDVDEVMVIGHSYNEIDAPYFQKVAQSISKNATWTLSYFSDSDRKNAEQLMESINIAPEFYGLRHSSEFILDDPQLKLFDNVATDSM